MSTVREVKKRLLIIEPDAEKRQLLSTYFSKSYECAETGTVESAIELSQLAEFSVVVAAVRDPNIMPKDLIRHLEKRSPRTIPIFLSEGRGQGNTVRAFRAGAFDVIQAPISLRAIDSAVRKAFAEYELKCVKEEYQNNLEELVLERTAELDHALDEIENSYRMTLKALVCALETRDRETHGHSERVVTFSLRLAHELGLDKDAMRDLELGSLLHDIGKIGVPDAILHKPAELDDQEWAQMRLHPIHGQSILKNIGFLEGAGRIVAQHHEKWDGTGYPNGLRGEAIDIGARIFAVVDAFDAIVSDRVYRDAQSYESAVKEIEGHSGTQFDPLIVTAFKGVPKEDWEILRERSLMEKQEGQSLQSIVAALVYSERQFEMVH
jgi:putative nucleotidyltransferase with HDIG domain